MAKGLEMLRPVFLLFLAFLWNSVFVNGSETTNNDQEISNLLLKNLNEEDGTIYNFNQAKIIETQFKDGTTYFLSNVSPVCKDEDDGLCVSSEMVCQGSLAGGQVSNVKCFLKESSPLAPQYEQGYLVKRSNNFTTGILEYGLQKLERDTGRKRRVLEILQVKKSQETTGTELFITAKVSAGSEGNGDVVELEICELEATLGAPGSMQILDTSTKCFALSDDFSVYKGNKMISTDQLKSLVNWALEKINVGTESVLNFTVTEITKAEENITPGSGGRITNLQLQLATSGCPKKDYLQEVQWNCVAIQPPMTCFLSTWERPWVGDSLLSRPHCKKMPANPTRSPDGGADVIKSRPGYCTGCLQEVNSEDQKVIELANSAIEFLNNGQLSATPHKLGKVISAHRQVINGVRYVLNVELTPCIQDSSPCTVAADAESSLKCQIEMIESAVERQRKLSSSLCEPIREVVTEAEVPVTTSEQTPAESSPAASAQEAGVYSDEDQGIVADYVPPVNGQEEKEDEVIYAQPHSTRKRTRRSSDGLLGSPEPIDLEKEGDNIRKLAEMALKNIDDIDDDANRRKLVDVVEAKKQVVNGILYHLTMRIAVMPPCDNGETDCVDGELPTLLCKVQVHQEPATKNGQPNTRVMRSECEPEGSFEVQEAEQPDGVPYVTSDANQGNSGSRTRRQVGGLNEVESDNPEVKKMAQLSVRQIDSSTNSLYHKALIQVVKAQTQVVAGVMYHLKVKLGYTSCRKGQTPNPEKCAAETGSEQEICDVKVWDRPWLNTTIVTNFTCYVSKERVRRSTHKIGGGTHDIHMGVFLKFMERHSKRYDDEQEFRRRFHIFRANMKKIQYLQETEQGTAKYGPTRFADLTTEEFKSQFLGLNQNLASKGKLKLQKAMIPNIKLADEFDWRNYNVVTPVKNQGQCGSCWAFSVTGNVEGLYAIQKGSLLSLSEQELVDCDSLDNGCNGGLPINAYEAITNIGGLETESDYPYDGKDEKCSFSEGKARVKVSGGLNITTDEDAMAKWLTKNGPISIGINANAMQFYFGGVSHPLKFLCSPSNLDHGVLIVGYGVHTTSIRHRVLPYWIVKNSWGPHWGEKGYYRVYRGDGTCGVNMMATSAILE